MSITTRHVVLSIAISFLSVSCGTDDKRYQTPREIKKQEESVPAENRTTEMPLSIRADKIVTLSDFEGSEFYRSYKLYKDGGWELKPRGYNNVYNTSSFPHTIFEVHTIDSEVIGFGIIFYERDKLTDTELDFVYNLLQSIDSKIKLNSSVKEYIKTNAERNVFQIKQATPISFGKFKIYAGRVGPEQTVSIQKI